MKRFYSLFLAVFVCSLFYVKAEYKKDTVNNLIFTGEWSGNAIVVEDDSLVYDTVYFDYRIANIKRDSFASWSLSGDLKYVSADTNKVVFSSIKPGKSRITYAYKRTPECGDKGYFHLDVYKHFDAASKYSIQIEGPECVGDTETVVYSIGPILTRNLNTGLGMDMYEWSIVYPDSIPFIDTVTYVSGDSSSITIKTGILQGGEHISVRVGRANEEYRIYKELGHAAPKPKINPICIPYNAEKIQVSVSEPVDGVIYSWSCDGEYWSFSPQQGTSVTLYPYDNSAAHVTVTAHYDGEQECSSSRSEIQVSRSWGRSAHIELDKRIPYEFDSIYTFVLNGEVAGGGIEWDSIKGWSVIDRINTSIILKPDSSELLKVIDSISVYAPNSCAPEGVDRRTEVIYMKPATVTRVSNTTCLNVGQNTFAITGWEKGPHAAEYVWYLNGISQGVHDETFSTNLTSAHTTVSVKPQVSKLDGSKYFGDSICFPLSFTPNPPTGIVPVHCITTGAPDTVTLRLTGVTPNQDYKWVLPSGIDSVSAGTHDTTMLVETNGRQGSYTIWAYGVGSDTCSLSEGVPYTFNLGVPDFDIDMNPMGNVIQFICTPTMSNVATSYKWYINGSYYSGFDTYQTFYFASTFDSVQVIITLNDGCKQSVIKKYSDFPTNQNNSPKRIRTNASPSDMKIIPNPANSHVDVKLIHHEGISEVYVFNPTGQKVISTITEEEFVHIDTSQLVDGVYTVVHILNGEMRSTDLLVIKH